MIPQVATKQYLEQKRITASTVRGVSKAWRLMQPDFDASWDSVSSRSRSLITAGQAAAALSAAAYVPSLMGELNIESDPYGMVNPMSVVGVASDGRTLEGLILGALTHSKSLVGAGFTTNAALKSGGKWLEMAASTQVRDAGRVVGGVAAYGERKLTRYTRMLSGKACSRCIILAGKIYYDKEAFLRHPKCLCTNIPCDEDVAGDLTTDPGSYFESLVPEDQDKIFTKAGAQAIRDGADMNQVVNARRSLYTTRGGLSATHEGATRRGIYGSSQTGVNKATGGRYSRAKMARLMPEEIYRIASSQEEAIRLLKYYKFLI